jgi:hypothetical protein
MTFFVRCCLFLRRASKLDIRLSICGIVTTCDPVSMLETSSFVLYSLSNSIDILNNSASASQEISIGTFNDILANDEEGATPPAPEQPSPDNNSPLSNPDDEDNTRINNEVQELVDEEATVPLPPIRRGLPEANPQGASDIDNRVNNTTAPRPNTPSGVPLVPAETDSEESEAAPNVPEQPAVPAEHDRDCNCNNCNEDRALKQR